MPSAYPRSNRPIRNGNLTLLREHSAISPFSVSAALGRNKLIYALADYSLVIACEVKSGGTWAGATESLNADWAPVFVRDADGVPAGNRKLIEKGGIAFPFPFPDAMEEVPTWMARQSPEGKQASLFG